MTDFNNDRFNPLLRKSALTLGCIMIMFGYVSGVHGSRGYPQSFPRSDGSFILQVQDRQANPVRKQDSPQDDRRNADNIVKSQILR